MIYLQKATKDDMDLIYRWANDSAVREASFNTNHISYEEHQAWYDKMMQDDNVLQFIMMDEDVAVGQIRLSVDGDEAEISYSIAAEYRGKGYARKMLELMRDEVCNNLTNINTLVAKVKPENSTSSKLFESEGYNLKYMYYTLGEIR